MKISAAAVTATDNWIRWNLTTSDIPRLIVSSTSARRAHGALREHCADQKGDSHDGNLIDLSITT